MRKTLTAIQSCPCKWKTLIIFVFNLKKTPIEQFHSHQTNIPADIQAISRIPIIPQLLDVICRTTKMGFAAIARVTEDRWVTCSALDHINFGLKPGDELKIETTFCNKIRQNGIPFIIDHVAKDKDFHEHPIPLQYGFQSYISFPIYRKDGSFFGTLCAIDTEPGKINTQEIKGMFQLFTDLISFHLQAVEEFDSTKAKLVKEREQSELREQFIAILGHDLRNPIATTRMSAEILLKIAKDEQSQKLAGLIKSTSYRMDGLIENVLDFARGRLGEGIILKLEQSNNTLEKTLVQVIKEIRTISPKRKIKTSFKLEEPVNCDAGRLGQLLGNLLSNADTHGAEDEPIDVTISSRKSKFILSVKNKGEKIPDHAMEHLFEPFYKEKMSAGKQGLGLGLFIASEIAHAHGGNLEVSSTNKQTCFSFTMSMKDSSTLLAAE